MPSTLLQRRPDIASSERRAPAANAQIGVQTGRLLPEPDPHRPGRLRLEPTGQLFNASNFFWSLGASAAQTMFDAGARKARVAAGARRL